MSHPINRREFGRTGLQTGIGAAAGLSLTHRPARASDRIGGSNQSIRLGMIGVGNRGTQLADAFGHHDDCEIVAAADVYEPFRSRAKEKFGDRCDVYLDYRSMLDRTDIDAVVIATPDHWHALQTIHAVAADKDVYVEKPLSATVVEGRAMIAAAARYERIVQVGLQRRSSDVFRELAQHVAAGNIGKVTVSRAYRLSNMYPDGIGIRQPSNPPAGLNWDMWLGPRARRAYQDNIAPYKFRWWNAYSSQMGNWGVHYFDAIRWMIGEEAPGAVVCVGGKFAVADDRTIPDTAEAVFELPGGSLLVFGQYEASGHAALAWGEVELRGTLGTVYAGGQGFRVVSEKPGQFQPAEPRAEPLQYDARQPASPTVAHARDFLDGVRNRTATRCPVKVGHRSTVFSHLANISLATGQRLQWDAEAERCIGNDAANDLLHYEYRKGYELPGG